MTLKKWSAEGVDYVDLNGNFNAGLRANLFNTITSLQDRAVTFSADGGDWAEAYNNATGTNNSVDTNLTTAVFDSDKYKLYTDTVYVQIEATSISGIWTINDCTIGEVSAGVWALYATTGTDEEKRAKIYKTLFYGTDGSDPRASSTYITGITALKTSVARDVGLQAYLAYTDTNDAGNNSYTGTFADTSTNTDCSSWSNIIQDGSSNEIGTDLSADEKSNPATCLIRGDINLTGNDNGYWQVPTATTLNILTDSAADRSRCYAIIICKGTISFAVTGGSFDTAQNTAFLGDNGIPLFTATSGTVNPSLVITHDIPTGTFSSTISTCLGSTKFTSDTAVFDVQFKLTNATEDTGWLDINEVSSFTAFTSEPTKCIGKLNSGSSSVYGFGVVER